MLNEDWPVLMSFIPDNWAELAIETKALRGLRKDKDLENYLRVLLIHIGCGYSMRETAARAKLSGLADISGSSEISVLAPRLIGSSGAEGGFFQAWLRRPMALEIITFFCYPDSAWRNGVRLCGDATGQGISRPTVAPMAHQAPGGDAARGQSLRTHWTPEPCLRKSCQTST